jgi:hypothetical protein
MKNLKIETESTVEGLIAYLKEVIEQLESGYEVGIDWEMGDVEEAEIEDEDLL